ncbi:cinnamoyl-CoA reductase 1-like [Curcuma longa]|uniref:cinnamoyl-CoA reductase 1-like n=1 Tax=Curcuma longa TaxID=136217 RepID=UPI003D9E4B3F
MPHLTRSLSLAPRAVSTRSHLTHRRQSLPHASLLLGFFFLLHHTTSPLSPSEARRLTVSLQQPLAKRHSPTSSLAVTVSPKLHSPQIDLLDPDSIIAAIRGCAGVFHLASPCTVDSVQNPQRELLDPAVKGTLNVLCTAKESGVCRVVVTSSISAIIPSPGWPADRVKDESCWTNLDYCRQKELWYPASKTMAPYGFYRRNFC